MERLEHILDETAARFPDRTALIFKGRHWTYAQLRDEIDRRAALLVERGVLPGQVVAAVALTTDDLILNFFACGRADVAFFHLSPRLTTTELAPLLARSGAVCVLTENGEPLPAAPALPTHPYTLPGEPGTAARAEAARRSAGGAANTPVLIQTTSGTTSGVPKLVLLGHDYFVRMRTMHAWWEEPGETILAPARYHLPARMVPRAILLGGTVILSPSLDADTWEAEMVRHGATSVWSHPAFLRLLAEKPHPPPPQLHVRIVRSGAAFLPPAVADALIRRYGCHIAQEYASSEANLITRTLPDTPPYSVGRSFSGVTCRIVYPDGTDVPEGEAGELVVRGEGMFLGYMNDPEATAQVMQGGWFWTGDRARRDAEGNYYLLGRTRLQINVGGSKVSPEEVEAVLEQHPRVREAVVLAAADAARGEVVRAVIVPRGDPPTAGEVRRFCRAHLASYKIPRVVEFRDELPRSPLGKVLRHLL